VFNLNFDQIRRIIGIRVCLCPQSVRSVNTVTDKAYDLKIKIKLLKKK
jgi:hypothetical protein